jgi:DNA polymerase III subunit epsilon
MMLKSLQITVPLTRYVDFAGRIIMDEKGVEIFNFGKHKGKSVEACISMKSRHIIPG